MLKDLDALFSWAARVAIDYPFVGFAVMGFAGGLIATIRLYERAGFEMTWRMLVARLLVKVSMGFFVGALVYLGFRLAGWRFELGLIVAAVSGVFSAEVLELLFVTGAQFFRKRIGLSPDAPPMRSASGPGEPGDQR
jgi:hypothetical protein